MGVYYNASLAWGLRIPQTPALIGEDLTDVYDIPAGYMYSVGGDEVNGENIAYVVHPVGACTSILDTGGFREEGFGVYSVQEIYNPAQEQADALVVLARQNGLDEDIGWFAISSVG